MSLGNRAGEAAEKFSLQGCDGSEVHLEDFEGSWLLIVFHRHLG
jgi:peroxiredoxin